ncbi:MAG TPA: hypothetical protein ENJ05_03535 [Thiotrichales bacterium]|nr:hypothetical protein [Thiotrichales bacterium]
MNARTLCLTFALAALTILPAPALPQEDDVPDHPAAGRIDFIDRTRHIVYINDQPYRYSPGITVTKANGRPGTLSDLKPGSHVRLENLHSPIEHLQLTTVPKDEHTRRQSMKREALRKHSQEGGRGQRIPQAAAEGR